MPQLSTNPVHLGLRASATPQPAFDGDAWFQDYAERTARDGVEGRLVSQHSFCESWSAWEMHPLGAEIVICTEGCLRLIQQFPDGREEASGLTAGDYAINPPGVWHTADIEPGTAATCIFITSGQGTKHRARQ